MKLDFDKRILDAIDMLYAHSEVFEYYEDDFEHYTSNEQEIIEKAINEADDYENLFSQELVESFKFDSLSASFFHNGNILKDADEFLERIKLSANMTKDIVRAFYGIIGSAFKSAEVKELIIEMYKGGKCKMTCLADTQISCLNDDTFEIDNSITKNFIQALVYASHYIVCAGRPNEIALKLFFE